MAKKKGKRPNRVSIHYEHLLYDLDFMSNENAGIILKMVVWYAMGDERSLKEIERMKKHIDVLPERPWLVSMYRRLFLCIDEDLEQYNEVCEKRRQAVAKREEYKRERLEKSASNDNTCNQMMSGNNRSSESTIIDSKGKTNDNTCNQMMSNDIQYNPIQSNPIQSNSSNEEINIWEEEEDACAREGKTEAPAIKTGDFMKIWNASVAKARKTSDTTAMKTLSEKDMPPDAEQRIDRVVKQIEQTLSEQDIGKVAEVAKLSPQQAQDRLVVTKWYLVIAMDRYSKVRMKPRDSSFGSFNWFVNEPDRIRKLFNGDIQ